MRLAPNVLVSMMSAPARTYSWCTSPRARARQVQRVEALVDEHALGVQHRAHRAIADEDAVFKRFSEVFAIRSFQSIVSMSIDQITRLPDYQIVT